MSFDAIIVKLANQGILYLNNFNRAYFDIFFLFLNKQFTYSLATLTKVSRDLFDKYAKSPLSILTPIALYPRSFNAKATAQKFKIPLLKLKKEFKIP
jgi:hypothetical protein